MGKKKINEKELKKVDGAGSIGVVVGDIKCSICNKDINSFYVIDNHKYCDECYEKICKIANIKKIYHDC